MQAAKTVAFGVAIGLPVAITAFELIGGPATVTGSSMQPTFNPSTGRVRDVVWVSRLSVTSGSFQPTPGHVVVIRSPTDPGDAMIKRIVAKAGHQISSRSYKRREVKVPKGHLWVEGDNSRTSRDSNLFGPVSEGLLVGVVSHVIWPPSRWQRVQHKLTNEQLQRTITSRSTGSRLQLHTDSVHPD